MNIYDCPDSLSHVLSESLFTDLLRRLQLMSGWNWLEYVGSTQLKAESIRSGFSSRQKCFQVLGSFLSNWCQVCNNSMQPKDFTVALCKFLIEAKLLLFSGMVAGDQLGNQFPSNPIRLYFLLQMRNKPRKLP